MVTTVTANAPAGAGGFYDLAAIYRASAPTTHGGLAVSAGIASRVQVNLSGHPVTEAHCTRTTAAPPPKAAPHAAGANPVPGIVLALVILAALVLIGLAIRKRMKRIT